MKVLVTGGAGYIGSFTVAALKKSGFDPIVFDSLETGHQEAIPGTPLYIGNLLKDRRLLNQVIQKERPQAIIHFAAYIEVGESVQNPYKYFSNNNTASLNLFKTMIDNNVRNIVFSSTAAVYGEPVKVAISENDPKIPTNPYGESKLITEKYLSWFSKSYGFSAIALRYFNASGAALDGSIGQDYPKPTHLITRACEAALGKRSDFTIFGNDYNTPDGTCIRDYIHVLDLASAHITALNSLPIGSPSFRSYNVGSGIGYSVNQVVSMVKKVSGVNFAAPYAPKRPGDPARLVAKVSKILKELKWKTKYSDIETIVKSAWQWHTKHPNGYKSPKN